MAFDRKEWQRKYNEEHKEELKEYKRDYYKKHKDQFKEYYKKWQKENKDFVNSKNRERRYNKRPYKYKVSKGESDSYCKYLKEVAEMIGCCSGTIRTSLARNNGAAVVNGFEIVDLEKNIVDESRLWPNNLSDDIFGDGRVIRNPELIMDQLPERTKDILLLRYRDHKTLEEIAKKYGVTRERIRQIERKAIRKLKVALRGGGHEL